MVRTGIVGFLVLITCTLALACSGKSGLTNPQGAEPGLQVGIPGTAGLPNIFSLDNSQAFKSTSTVEHIPGFYYEGNNTANAEPAGVDAIKLTSDATNFSAVWYGVNITYFDRIIPYLAPYTMTINTSGNGQYWVMLADFKSGHWRVLPEPFYGENIEVEIGLEPNAGNEWGTFWCAIVASGGEIVTVQSIDMTFPDPPFVEEYVIYPTKIIAADTTMLATEVYLPLENNFDMPPLPSPPDPPYPVILFRTPYDKQSIVDTQFEIMGNDRSMLNWMAELNIVVVNQYFRGRLEDSGGYPDSGGTETLFREHAGPLHTDAIDTVAWLEKRNFYSGQLFMTGPSALGLGVYQAATQLGDRVTGIYPQASSADVGTWAASSNGCFKQGNLEGWLVANNFPLELYSEAKANFHNQEYWDSVNFDLQASGTNCPGYHETGWWDVDVSSTINSWREINENGGPNAQGNQWLVIGPWSHTTLRQSQVGEITFPVSPPANSAIDLPFGWDGSLWALGLLGRDLSIPTPAKNVLAYFMGEAENTSGFNNLWVELDNWPPQSSLSTFYLTALGGLDGTGDIDASSSPINCDPKSPHLTLGGEMLPTVVQDPGPANQIGLYSSPNIQNFRSEVLAGPLVIAGEITVDLYVSTQATDTDIMVKLIDQYPAGQQMLVADSAVRLSYYVGGEITPGEVYHISFPIGDRAYVFEADHRIGIDVQSSNYPRFSINPGNGDDFIDFGGGDIVQLNQLYLGPSSMSAVHLPVYQP